MKSPRLLALSVVLLAAAAQAAKADMRDPRRAVGREDDVRVDAELIQDSISPNATLGVVYQVQNLTNTPIALADKVSDVSYDSDTQTITVSFGAEVPPGESMPHLVVIPPGEKKTFRGGAPIHIVAPGIHTPWASIPHFVQIRVTVLREVAPFVELIEQQNKSTTAPPLSKDAFDRWVDNVDSVLLNAIPVRWDGRSRPGGVDAESGSPGGM